MDATSTDQQPAAEPEAAPRCQFPGCTSAPEPKDPSTPGPAPRYCERDDHTALTAYRAKRKKPAGSSSASDRRTEALVDRPVSMAALVAGDLRGEVVNAMKALTGDLSRYVEQLQTITDPEAAEAQMLAVTSEAAAATAELQHQLDVERSGRFNAENLTMAAKDEARAYEAAAEQAVTELDSKTAEHERLQAELREQTAEQVREVTAAAAAEVERINAEADTKVRAEEDRAQAAIDQAAADIAAATAALAKELATGKAALETENQRREELTRQVTADTEARTVEAEKGRKAAEDAKAKAEALLKDGLAKATKEVEQAKAERAAAESAAGIALAQAEARQESITQLQAEVQRLVAAEATAKKESDKRITALESKLTTAQEANDAAKDSVRDLRAKVTTHEQTITQLQGDAERQAAGAESAKTEADQRISSLESKLSAAQSTASTALAQAEARQESITQLQAQITQLQAQAERMVTATKTQPKSGK
jgi:colicin import membrane protein